ncbi:hypothetical protein AADZ91_09050 [Colwelliaceae bacterium 6441]
MSHLPKSLLVLMLLITKGLSNSQAQSIDENSIKGGSIKIDSIKQTATQGKSKKLLPESLLGAWTLDKEASIEYAKTTPHWNEKVAKFFPKLLELYSTQVQQFTEDSFIVTQDKQQMLFTANVLMEKGSQIDLALKKDSYSSTLYIQKTKNNLLNIQGENLLGYEFFLWKKNKPYKAISARL